MFHLDQLSLACGYDNDNLVIGKEDLKKVGEILSRYPSLLNESLDIYGYTPLIVASYWNSRSVVEFLLSCDEINVNQQDKVGF
jgi:ankyrin repeat protein